MMMLITAALIKSAIGYHSRWNAERLRVAVPEPITVQDFLRRQDIYSGDRVLLILHENLYPRKAATLFACDCIDQVLLRGYRPDAAFRKAVVITRQFVKGKAAKATFEHAWITALQDTRTVMREHVINKGYIPPIVNLTWETAKYFSWDYVWDAANAAGQAAAWSVSEDEGPTGKSIRDAERERQANHLIELLEADDA